MKIYELKFKIYLLRNIIAEEALETISKVIDKGFSLNEVMLDYHKCKGFKEYCFNNPFPTEEDKIYKEDKIYTVIIRTINSKIAKYFLETLSNINTQDIKGLKIECRVLPKKHIEKIYSITPAIMKNDFGYWQENMSISSFEKRLKDNMFKKYKEFCNKDINEEDTEIYTALNFKNKKPVFINYKGIKLLGDKIEIMIDDDELSQDIAYMLLGTGILENNSRGAGFVGFRWL